MAGATEVPSKSNINGLHWQRRLKSAVESKGYLERLATSLSAAEQPLSNFTVYRLEAFAGSGRVWRVQLLAVPTMDALGKWLRVKDLTQSASRA